MNPDATQPRKTSATLPKPPPAPETRAAEKPAEATKPPPEATEAPKEKAKIDPLLREHTLKPTEVKPIHRFVGRIANKVGFSPLEDDEMEALNEHGAVFWSRWVKTQWGAAALAYVGTWGEVLSARAVEYAMMRRAQMSDEAREKARTAAPSDQAAETLRDKDVKVTPRPNGADEPDVNLPDSGSRVYGSD